MNIIDLKKQDFLEIQNNFLNNTNNENCFGEFNFLQSFQWSEIQREYGQNVFLKGLEFDNKIVGFFVAIEKRIFNSRVYWYIPRGPIFFDNKKNYWSSFFLAIRNNFSDRNIKFIRLEPVYSSFLKYYENASSDLKRTSDIQPSKTSFLDLNSSEDELLNSFSQKTRYNIRLSKKRGVEIKKFDVNSFSEFWELMSVTAKRDNFFIHDKEYYRKLIEHDSNFIKLFSASFNGSVLAAGIFSFFSSTVSYLHGSSSSEMRSLMAPHFLQWELIKLAKRSGFRYYDFYGIDERRWPGVSRFKKGFSGKIFSFPGTFDYLLDDNFYLLYKFSRNFKRELRKILSF